MKIYLTLFFLITLCILFRGFIFRSISKKKYNTSCTIVYLPERQRVDSDILIQQEKDNFDRNFKNPLDEQFRDSEISRIIEKQKSKIINESELYPERGSRVDPYY